MREPCNVLQSGPRFDFLQLFFSFRHLCKSYSPLPSTSLWTYAEPLPPSQSLFFSVVRQNPSTQKKIANLKSKIPSLAFHSELYYRSTSLSGSSAKLQWCRSRKLHASLLVVQDVHFRFAEETLRRRPISQAACSQTTFLPKEMLQPS